MKKRYYIRRWKKLDRLYDEFHRINVLLKDDEDNVELLYFKKQKRHKTYNNKHSYNF